MKPAPGGDVRLERELSQNGKNQIDSGGSRLSTVLQNIHEKIKETPLEERVLTGRIKYKKFTLFHFHGVAKRCA